MVGTTRLGNIDFEMSWLRTQPKPLPSPAEVVFLLPSLLVLALVCSFSPTHLCFNPDHRHDEETNLHSNLFHLEED